MRRELWFNVEKSADANHTPNWWLHVCHYQFVFLPFTMDEKAASSIAFRVHDLTDPHATDPASFLWEPSPAGVISGHNHSLDTHNIAVTKTTRRRMGHDNGLEDLGHVPQCKMTISQSVLLSIHYNNIYTGSNLKRWSISTFKKKKINKNN